MGLEQALPHLPRLRRHARLLTGDAARADDLLQDTLERAARKWSLWQPRPGPDGDDGLRSWLLTLMHHLFLTQIRDRREHLHEPFGPEHERGHDPHAATGLRLDLARALERLSPAAREVLLLVGVEELSYEEAARVLGVPVGTVMSRLSRARERLRALMAAAPGAGAAPPAPARPNGPALRVVK